MKAVFWIVIALLAAVLALFALSNRETVSLGLWPFPFLIETPLYLLVMLAALVGFAVGEAVAWLSGRHVRREARQRGRRIAALERELAASQARLAPSVPGLLPTAPPEAAE